MEELREQINTWLLQEFKSDEEVQEKIISNFKTHLSSQHIRSPILHEIIVGNHEYFKKRIEFKLNPKGINLIIGANISGKSTIIDLLKLSVTAKFRKEIKKLRVKPGTELILSLIYGYKDSFYENKLINKRDHIKLEINSIEDYDPENRDLIKRQPYSNSDQSKSETLNKYYSIIN